MKRILFVCYGNICRSPMAEFLFRELVRKAGLEGELQCASAATSNEETGHDIYGKAQRKLREMSVPFESRHARRIVQKDYEEFDLLLGMERRNTSAMQRFFGGDPKGKIRLLLDFTDNPRDIADPWYTDDFDLAYDEILEGCQALLRQLRGTV